MNQLSRYFSRFYNSSVAWMWLFNGLRLGSGVLLLPLLALLLSKPDLGMYMVFLALSAFVPIIDFGFSVSIGRNVSYAMGGVRELQAHGLTHSESAEPNFPLLWQMVGATRQLYRYLSLVAAVFLGICGTVMVGLRIEETDSPTLTWCAWSIALLAAVWEIYTGWWNVFLRGMNNVLLAARLSVIAYGLQLVVASILLVSGAGLLSLPVATIISSFLQRFLARRACLKMLNQQPAAVASLKVNDLLSLIWPSSWRTGIQFLSTYLSSSVSLFLCVAFFGLETGAKFGLSVRIISIIQGMAAVWTSVKWPIIGQLRAQNNFSGLQKIFKPRVQLQMVTFILFVAFAIPLSPLLLQWIGSDKELLPAFWFSLLALIALLEMHYSVWGTLIFMANKMPYLWPVVISNLANIPIALLLINYSSLGVGSFVLAPLLTGILCNYWKWPAEGAKSLNTSWSRMMLTKA